MIKKLTITVLMFIAFFAIGYKWVNSSDPNVSMGEWENVHEWKERGDCLQCHSSETDSNNSQGLNGAFIQPSKMHTEKFRKYTHGRIIGLTSSGCFSCHKQESCRDCHNIMPEGHTSDFTHPGGDSLGMKRHILIGRLRPSNCLVCHQSFVQDCQGCHATNKLQKWQLKGHKGLSKWLKLQEALPSHHQINKEMDQ